METDCPHCHETVEIEGEDLPSRACDEEDFSCPSCDSPVKLGWYAQPTMAKP